MCILGDGQQANLCCPNSMVEDALTLSLTMTLTLGYSGGRNLQDSPSFSEAYCGTVSRDY